MHALATNQFYGSIVEILAQASEQGLDLADKRMRVLLMIFHHFRSNPSFRDPTCFQPRQLEVLRTQSEAYMSLVQGISPSSASLAYLSNFQITPTGRSLGGILAQRAAFHSSQYVRPPPPLDGPDGVIDWPGHLYPQLRAARVRKRAAQSLERETDVSRLLKLVDMQRRVRAALVEQHKRPRLMSVPVRPPRPVDPMQQHTKFLHDLLLHRQQFVDFHRRKRDALRRVGHAVIRRLAVGTAPVAETAEARLQRERIVALKSQDEEAYLRLLAESKNERLNELIRQTEDYMRTLGALVLEHKGDAVQASNKHGDDEDKEHGLIRAKKEYFSITHAVAETVSEQPMSLSRNLRMREYQLKGLEYLVSLHNNRLSGILADEQGLGKSCTTIAFMSWLWENRGVGGPFMIIAPLSVLKSTWVSELRRWSPPLAEGMVVYEGHKAQRKELKLRYLDPMAKSQQTGGEGESAQSRTMPAFTVLLTTDAFILRDHSALRKVQWQYIIVDEAHRLKNPKSKLVQTLNKHFVSNYRLALTGTPLQNDLLEVWALLNFLMPKIFSSHDSFRDWFAGPLAVATKGSRGAVDLSEEEKLLVIDRLHKVLKPFILRRTKDEVMKELPRKTEQIVWCNLTDVQKRMYDDIVTVQGQGGGPTDQPHVPWEIGKGQNIQMSLRKVCNHPFLFATALERVPADESLVRSCGKFVMLDGILARLKASPSKHRVLIFSQMTKVLDVLELFMNYRDHTYVRLDGSTSSEQREAVISQFCAPNADIFCFLMSTRSGSLGLNLTVADTVIIYDQDFNPAGDEQAKARTHRIGQTKETLVLRLVTRNSIEERMLDIAATKQQQDELVIQQGKYHHDIEQQTIEEKREKLLEIFGRGDGYGRRPEEVENGVGDSLEMERGDNERWVFDKVDARMRQLGFKQGLNKRVLPPCLLKSGASEAVVADEVKLWKAAYQAMDAEYSLKLLVQTDPRAVTGCSDFAEELRLKRHKLNEAVYSTMNVCLQKFGWTQKQAPVIFEVRNAGKSGVFMSIHQVERALQAILQYAQNTEYFWCVKLIGAVLCKIRRLLWPADGHLAIFDDDGRMSSSDEDEMDEEEDEEVEQLHIDQSLGFTKFLDE